MRAPSHGIRHTIAHTTLLALTMIFLSPTDAHAAGNARFELRPHCGAENEMENVFGGPMPDAELLVGTTDGRCASFEVRDPQNLQTPELMPGDILDMDLIIHNPDRKPIERFRAWIAYDASALEGTNVVVSPEFPVPTPGENAFSAQEGFIKISGTADGPVTDEKIVVARVRLRVTRPGSSGTPLTYFDLSDNAESRTGVFTRDGATESNVLVANPGYLFVRFATEGIQHASSSSASSVAATTSSDAASTQTASSAASVGSSTVFTMLQVQGVRVTTEGSSVFLAWDALPSTELVGYNVYYGTTMGSYIQRRGVDKSATSITIRALPVDTTYYFAVRGVNGEGRETEFSREVGVSVGNPRTSTSPLTGSLPAGTPSTNGSVAGETGVSSVLLAFLTLSAVIGTVIAFRRQWAVSEA